MSAKRKLVYFGVTLKGGVNPDEVKIELEKLSKGLIISILRFKNIGKAYVAGVCNKAVYERVFNARLRRETRTVRNLNKGAVKESYWVELVAAVIPEQFQNKIQSIRLDQGIVLTD